MLKRVSPLVIKGHVNLGQGIALALSKVNDGETGYHPVLGAAKQYAARGNGVPPRYGDETVLA